MIMIAAFVIAAATVPLAGGTLRCLAQVELRGTSILFAALALQIVVIEFLPATVPGLNLLHLGSYAMAFAFLVANRRLPGMRFVFIGGAANLAAIAANGGTMPASATALSIAGMDGKSAHFANSAAVPHAHLAVLGDIFALPAQMPLANVFSIGDVLLVVGGVVMLHSLCGSRWRRTARSDPEAISASSTEPKRLHFVDAEPLAAAWRAATSRVGQGVMVTIEPLPNTSADA